MGLSAILLLPSSQLLLNSVRGAHGMLFSETTFWSLHPPSLPEIMLPDFYGSIENPTTWTEAVGTPKTPYFPSVFLGFVPLFLALVGWAWGCDWRSNFVAGTCLLFLLLSMGRLHPPVCAGLLADTPAAACTVPGEAAGFLRAPGGGPGRMGC